MRPSDLFTPKNSRFYLLREWLVTRVLRHKFNSVAGVLVLLMAALPLAFSLASVELQFGVVIFLALIGVPLVGFCVVNLPFAMAMMLVTALMVPFAAKFTSAPIGTLLDLLILVGGVGVLLRQLQERDWSFVKHPLSYMILIWLYYNIIQVLNPAAESKLAWVYTVRSVAIQQSVFFIGAYALRFSQQSIYTLLKVIAGICIAAALYGYKQQFIGFSAAEEAWIYADPERFQLYYQWGMMRIPSFCYDPTTFGILMACFGMGCVPLIMGPARGWVRIALGVAVVISIWMTAYTGTRTAYVLIPIGGIFYAGLILNWRVLVLGGVLALGGAVFVLKSTSSGVIYRIQSAFRPTEDDSMNLRLANQKKIQPYIQSHPMGGGLGSCGVWGKRFNPDSELANFPHDSSFVRMGVELGWIGLILYTLLHYYVLRTGLLYYFRCRDPWIKAIYAGITTWCFMLAIACYAQEAILQLPMNVIYNVFLAILVTLKNFDREETPAEA